MRRVAPILLMLLAFPVAGQVKLHVKADGTKVISNIGPNGKGRSTDWSWWAKQHDRRSRYDEIIERHAEKYRVDPVLVRAVIQVESNFDPQCVSRKGARGLMQLMPGTARRFGVKDVHDPEENIRGGVRYLAYLLTFFRNDLDRVLAGYNAGENAVVRHGGIPPYSETETYVARALTVYYGRPHGQSLMFAGSRGGPKLKGGFHRNVQPMAAVMMPGMKILGTQ